MKELNRLDTLAQRFDPMECGSAIRNVEGIECYDICNHFPDQLSHITTYRNDEQGAIVEVFKCECGKTIKDIFKRANTVVS